MVDQVYTHGTEYSSRGLEQLWKGFVSSPSASDQAEKLLRC
jgi:hypothetical protein